jgi:hypothetical protein
MRFASLSVKLRATTADAPTEADRRAPTATPTHTGAQNARDDGNSFARLRRREDGGIPPHAATTGE